MICYLFCLGPQESELNPIMPFMASPFENLITSSDGGVIKCAAEKTLRC